VVGEAATAGGDFHAFLWAGGAMQDLGTLGGAASQARAINAAGQVVGWSHRADGTSPHAFLSRAGVMIDLGTLPGFSGSWANGINARGQIVGFAGVVDDRLGTFTQRAFLVEDGVMTDLNALIPPDTGWTLAAADAINDAGQIVGFGLIGGEKHAFLLTPVTPTPVPIPEPSTLALLGLATAAAGARLGVHRSHRGGCGARRG
ncbi:MAG TPA: PEP-CTERM sorting domain-containing protein, partial [Isosphaeraceae bacterium]